MKFQEFDGVHVLADPRHVFFPRIILRLQSEELCELERTIAFLEPPTDFESQAQDIWCKGGDVRQRSDYPYLGR
jgi:hypothetical protein